MVITVSKTRQNGCCPDNRRQMISGPAVNAPLIDMGFTLP